MSGARYCVGMAWREAARLFRSSMAVDMSAATHAAGVRQSPRFERYLRELGSGRGRCVSVAAQMLSSPDQRARYAAAAYPGCPPAVLRFTPEVSRRAAEVAGTRLDAANIDESKRLRAADHPSAPPVLLSLLAADSAYPVRLAAAANHATPTYTITALTSDDEALVAEAAAVNAARGDHAATQEALRSAVQAECDRLRYTDSWGDHTHTAAESGDFHYPDPDVFIGVDDYIGALLGPDADSLTYDTAEDLLREAITEAFALDAQDAQDL